MDGIRSGLDDRGHLCRSLRGGLSPAETKDTGYTTTLKTMQIMHAKGMVTRDEENRSHIYKPATNQQDTQNSLLKNLMSTAFGGSSKKLVMQALGQDNPSKDEIDEIRAFLDQLENK
jgi:predicted transcriptional regulator